MSREQLIATVGLVLGLVVTLPACGPPKAEVLQEGDRILIRDNTGKTWDVSTAVRVYGFDPAGFQFGLGPNAIPPLVAPQMLAPGDPGYPADSDGIAVLGTMINGEARAYPISVLSRVEVANEVFGDTHVAVAY